MSYSCPISFKQIKGDELYSFFQKLKEATSSDEGLDSLAEDNYAFSPLFKDMTKYEDGYFEKSEYNMVEDKMFYAIQDWAKQHIFTYRWFYDAEAGILGFYSMNKAQQKLFDNTVYFQNSCDQDYDWDVWNGIPAFETIARSFKGMNLEQLNQYRKSRQMWELDEADDLEYYKKSTCYDVIWKRFEDTLYDDSKAVYLTLVGYYDFTLMNKFATKVVLKVKSWVEDCKRKVSDKDE